jgi:hypothetical protein
MIYTSLFPFTPKYILYCQFLTYMYGRNWEFAHILERERGCFGYIMGVLKKPYDICQVPVERSITLADPRGGGGPDPPFEIHSFLFYMVKKI